MSTAVSTKILSPHTIGEALPLPGMGVFHLMFFSASHSVGGLPSEASPLPFGPRHWCQFDSACSTAYAEGAVTHAIPSANADKK